MKKAFINSFDYSEITILEMGKIWSLRATGSRLNNFVMNGYSHCHTLPSTTILWLKYSLYSTFALLKLS